MPMPTRDIAAGKSELPVLKSVPKEKEFLRGSSKYCSFCQAEMEPDEITGTMSCSQCGRCATSFY